MDEIACYVRVSDEILSDIKNLKWYFKKIILFKKIKILINTKRMHLKMSRWMKK